MGDIVTPLRGQTQPAGRIYSSWFPFVPAGQPVALPPSPRHPQCAISYWVMVECREQDTEEVLTITETAMLDAMKQLAKDRPVEVEDGIGKTWGSAK